MYRSVHPQPDASVGLLLIHGLTGMPSEMRSVEKHFKKRGFQIRTPLLKGHGGTHRDLITTSWSDWLDSLAEDIAQFTQKCRHVFVIGFCAGSLLATLIAARYPQISGIALLSQTLNRFQKGKSPLERWLPLLLKCPFLFDKLYWAEKPPYGLKDEKLQRKIGQTLKEARDGTLKGQGAFLIYLESFYQLEQLSNAVQMEAGNVSCPALIIHSVEDSMAHPDNVTLLYSLLYSAKRSLHFIDGCDHMMTLDLKKHEVNNLIERFIDGHVPEAVQIPLCVGGIL